MQSEEQKGASCPGYDGDEVKDLEGPIRVFWEAEAELSRRIPQKTCTTKGHPGGDHRVGRSSR